MVLSQSREFAYDDLALGIRRVMRPNGSFPNSGSIARGEIVWFQKITNLEKSLGYGRGVRETKLTPLKTNMEPKNEGLQDDFAFQEDDFQVNHISLRGLRQCKSTTSE